eukprot:CAMPEP_0184492566 /NCGR_PEP_ID=MMETSP0113_2-20130426/23695_1 /TAXON_ID=91329 /ORGANISM="Norrisiella sphaerica, Strain BC52" /LENGTH=317 /DNA_ID=CAMNT_0026877443 /DNA_START=155 /DNA_END=1105 /DNA_ORIENTATION=-
MSHNSFTRIQIFVFAAIGLVLLSHNSQIFALLRLKEPFSSPLRVQVWDTTRGSLDLLTASKLAFTPSRQQEEECKAWLAGTPATNTFTSQYGQDTWLFNNIFRHFHMVTGKQDGIYVDLAAFHPRNLSNTYFLDVCLGWRGICIEADPAKAKRFKADPPTRGCLFVESCVAETDGKVIRFESHPDRGDVTSLEKRNSTQQSRSAGAWFSKKQGAPKEVDLQCKTLNTILAEAGVDHVDFMSLDIEGNEPEALANPSTATFDIINMEGSPELVNGVNAKATDPTPHSAKRAGDILRRKGYTMITGTGMRSNNPIDSLW